MYKKAVRAGNADRYTAMATLFGTLTRPIAKSIAGVHGIAIAIIVAASARGDRTAFRTDLLPA